MRYAAGMALEPWDPISEESHFQFKAFEVRKALRRSPRTGKEVGLFILDTLNWVNVVAFTKEQELILVRQYRHGTKDFTLEIPGGVVHDGEDPETAARRELREESGYAPGRFTRIGRCAPNPAFQTNHITTYLATDCELRGELIQDQGEDLEVVLVPADEAEAKVLAGEIDHALVLAGLYFYKLQNG